MVLSMKGYERKPYNAADGLSFVYLNDSVSN